MSPAMSAMRSCRGNSGRVTQPARYALLLPIARALGLPRLLITCDEDNHASRRVIEANGGVPDGTEPQGEMTAVRKLRFWVAAGSRPAESDPLASSSARPDHQEAP